MIFVEYEYKTNILFLFSHTYVCQLQATSCYRLVKRTQVTDAAEGLLCTTSGQGMMINAE